MLNHGDVTTNAVTTVTHSARTTKDLDECIPNLYHMTDDEEKHWQEYGNLIYDKGSNFEVLYP